MIFVIDEQGVVQGGPDHPEKKMATLSPEIALLIPPVWIKKATP